MSNDGVNTSRRTLLIGATAGVAAIGAGFVAVPFVKSWQPSARAKNAGAPVKIDISKLEPGGRAQVEWRGKPIWVVRRTEEQLAKLQALDPDMLKDPDNTADQQPPYASNVYRAIKPEYVVLEGVCTHLGCAPSYIKTSSENLPEGGFFCPCHGSKFDFSGRVYKNVPAAANLPVPPHSYLSESVVIVGSEEGETEA
ncbi:MAG: ubiquinol-cytochrome c reductase iron-sulfur subunit [Alcanivoracaceae bacterium]|nr:ubiquinol-cytochrome c reductase iron-sulfur subunit [Alcanivoracaceae bacterium]